MSSEGTDHQFSLHTWVFTSHSFHYVIFFTEDFKILEEVLQRSSSLPLNELPQQSCVHEFLSHNTTRSHPELSGLNSQPSRGNKSLGMLSEAEGRSILSWMRHLLTLIPSLSMSHNKGGWRMWHKSWIGHSQPVIDHLRMYYNLLVTRDQKTGPLNLFGLAYRWVSLVVKPLFARGEEQRSGRIHLLRCYQWVPEDYSCLKKTCVFSLQKAYSSQEDGFEGFEDTEDF